LGRSRAHLKAPLERFIRTHIDKGQTAVLRPIVEGRLSLLRAYEAYQRNELSLDEPAEYNALAHERLNAWLATAPYKPLTRAGIEKAFKWLWKQLPATARDAAGEPNVRVRELPTLLQEFRRHTNYATFRNLKAAFQAYARTSFTDDSTLWKALAKVESLKAPITSRMTHRSPLVMPWEARWVRHALESRYLRGHKATAAEAARLWWLSCLTGMGPQEMWEDGYALTAEGLEVAGGKNKNRHRVVPVVLPDRFYHPPTITRDAYENRLERARRWLGIDVTPYSGRRAFSHWEEAAGVPLSRRKAHLGHGTPSQTDHYALEVKPYLDRDGAALAAYVTANAWAPPRDALAGGSRRIVAV
jgi:hypothetical protein